ncbi:phospholipase D family protein [Desulfosediminicola ganghwensis]|uniref:phospholipase D family protein n=1 Tax=Desulfosediminicola ganghwensis TaxID=2569540 RepID=UPI0010AC3A9F|nr:phospholipase D family protein [Desulfosediminicola ganghwensis]
MHLVHAIQLHTLSMTASRYKLVILLLLILFLYGCASLPPRPNLEYESALPAANTGILPDLAQGFRASHGNEASGFHLLIDAEESLTARLALIDSAKNSLDLQYFIWKDDAVGILLLDRIMKAADRGVKVRVIVDDVWLASSTRTLTRLNSHPNLKIRIFNPNPARDTFISRELHFIASYHSLNRRMHNKLMIVDNQAIIAGGRNIGNEYFGLSNKFNFLDIDVMAIGDVVKEASFAFDDYWNTDTVFPVSGWHQKMGKVDFANMKEDVEKSLWKHKKLLQSYPLQPQNWDNWFSDIGERLHVGEAYFLQDDPVKIDGRDYRLIDMISYFSDPTEKELIISSPYFIPVGDSLAVMERLESDGIQIKVFTNSLASTNHTLVNSHYKKYRRNILLTGAELFEFNHQPSNEVIELASAQSVTPRFISLHAKVMISDRRKCFIGSLNFDPRALVINSENGLLIDSPSLTGELTDFLNEIMEEKNSWYVVVNDNNSIEWRSEQSTRTTQPSRSFFQTLSDFFGRFLPVEGQL